MAFCARCRRLSGEPSAPVVIVSGSTADYGIDATQVNFVMKKPTSVEQAVHTLSAARNLILKGRLRYHRQVLVRSGLTDLRGRSGSSKAIS